ncbi:MAG: YesL family protein [Lachnospiraceae bacterium]
MAGAFHFESRLFRVIEKGINLIKLNIIWMLFSLPVVTGGAALCALHVTAVKILKGEEGYVFQDFWKVFKSKLGISLKLWLPLLFAAAGLMFDYVFWQSVDGGFADGMRVLVCVLAGMWLALVIYLFPLAARTDAPAGKTWRGGLLLVFKYLPQTMYLLFITGLFLAAGLLWTPVFGAGLLAGGSLMAIVHGKMLLWIFEKEMS